MTAGSASNNSDINTWSKDAIIVHSALYSITNELVYLFKIKYLKK